MQYQSRATHAPSRLDTMLRKVAVAGLLSFASLAAGAATYNYTTSAYTAWNTFTVPCSLGSCANFTAAMTLQGSFTTAAPLAPNLNTVSVAAQVTGFSFFDGLTTYSSSDPQSFLMSMVVTTDASGTITTFDARIARFQTGGAHAVGDRLDEIRPSSAGGLSIHNRYCTSMASPTACATTTFDSNYSAASSLGVVPQPAANPPPSPTAVPALDTLGMGLLAAMVGLFGWLGMGRRRA